MAGLKFDITGDNSNMLSALQGVQNGVRQTEKVVEQSGAGIEEMFGKMQSAATAMIGAFSLQQLASKVTQVRGEFQQLEIAFTTMLGSASKANELMEQLIKTAATTPFDLQGIAQGAKQLLAYGIQADQVNDTLVRLGDIAAGLSIPLGDLVYLYGTTIVQGRMFTQDLRQFQGRGVPIAEELAKQFGVAKEKVGELVTAGKVGAEEFNKAIMSMTSEGGKFGGLMEAQSRTITGQLSNLEDSFEQMFNEIGKSSEGIISDTISATSTVVENWRTVGEALLAVLTAYGAYKAAVISTAAIQEAVKNIRHTEEAAQLYAVMTAEQQARISKLNLSKASEEYYLAVKAETQAEMERQTQLAVTTQTELAAARERFAVAERDKAVAIEKVAVKQAELEAVLQEAAAEQSAGLKKKISIESEAQSRAALRAQRLQEQKEALISQAQALKELQASREIVAAKNREIAAISQKLAVAKAEEIQRSRNIVELRREMAATVDATTSKKVARATAALETAEENLNTAAKARNTAARSVSSKAALLDSTLRRANTVETAANTAAQTANATASGFLSAAKTRLTAVAARLNAVIMANPWAVALAAVVALGYGIYKLASHQTDAQKAQQKLDDATKEYNKTIAAEQAQIDSVFARLKTAKKGTEEYRNAKQAVISQYGKYLTGLNSEAKSLNNVEAAYRAVSAAARDAAKARSMEAFTKDAADTYATTESEQKEKLYSLLKERYGGQKDKSGMSKAESLYWQLVKVIDGRGKLNEKWAKQFDRTHYVAGDTETGIGSYSYTTNEIQDILSKIRGAKSSYNKTMEEAARRFGDNPLDKTEEKQAADVKNKKYWEDYQKEQQGLLDAMTAAELKTKKAAQIRANIANAQKEIDAYSVSKTTAGSKETTKIEDSKVERIAKIQEYEKSVLEQQKEAELTLRQQNIDLKEESFEKEIEQINLNYDRLKAENEKRRNGMIEALKENLVNKWLNQNPKATKSQQARYKDSLNLTEDDLNKKQRDQLSEYDRIAEEMKKKATADLFRAQQAALYDYLKEYGTVQEQMYAIAKEYDEKIAKEKDENRKRSLEREKASALAKSNTGNLALDIDWGTTFGGIGSVLKDIAKETLKEVEQYMRSAEFKNLSPTDKRSYMDLRNKLHSEGSGETSSPFKFSQWGEIEKLTHAYQESVRNLKEKTKEHTEAITELQKAEKELSNSTTEASRSIALTKVEAARERVQSTAVDLNNAKEDKDNKKGTLRDSTDKAVQGLNDFSSALQQMSNGTLKGFADGVANVISSIGGKGVGGLIGALGSKAGGLIGAILQIIDALGDDPTGFIKGLLDKIAKVVETILQQLPDLIIGILKGVGNVIGSIISGIGSWFVGGGNEKDMEKEISNLAKSNEILAQRIEELSKNINKKDNTNEQSLEAYKKAKAAEDEWESNQRKSIDARASEWTNKGYGFLGLGGKKSFNALSKGRDWWGWSDFNEKLAEIGSKSKVFSVQDMWKLTPEEMKALRDYKDTAWREFFDNSGHKNPEELVSQYIDRAGKRDELTSALNEKLTGYSWDGFMDSYKSVLKNLESTTADFANNINEMISNALLESFTNEELKPRIKALYDYIAKAAEDGLDSGEIDYIRKSNDEIAALGLKKREELEQAGIIRRKDSEQNASANGVSNITYEQANNIVALTTAGNISRDQIKDLVNSVMSNVSAMAMLSSSTNSAVLEIRNLMIYNNSYLEDILKCSKSIYADFSKKIDDVNKNLKEMK